jgi:hypothetical protein
MGDGGGFQQIIIIGLFLLFGLADLIARWARGRTQSQRPNEPERRPMEGEEDPWQVDMPWRDDDDVAVQRPVRVDESVRGPTHESVEREQLRRERRALEREQLQREEARREQMQREAEAARSAPSRMGTDRTARDRTARDRTARDRTSSVRQAVVRTAPVRPVASRVATGGLSARDRMAAGSSVTRRRGLTFTADDARRGVIAMTVLGPCRALEDPARGL